MGLALPWRWFVILGFVSDEYARLLSYFLSPLLVLVTIFVVYNVDLHSHCLIQHLLDIPCPGCGITSSLYGILTGNYGLAWSCNPCGFLVIILLLGQTLVTSLEVFLILKPDTRFRLILWGNTILTICLLSVWACRLISLN